MLNNYPRFGGGFLTTARTMNMRKFQDKLMYRGFEIQPKNDFGIYQNVMDLDLIGYVAVQDACNMMPGATWSETVEGAIEMIDTYIAADGDSSTFWATLPCRQENTL